MNSSDTLSPFEHWYQQQKHGNSDVPKGTIAGALVVLDHLKSAYNLDLEAHLTPGGAQIRGASGENIKDILSRFGEERHFVSEGGRTNRGLRLAIGNMLDTLAALNLDQLTMDERNRTLELFQQFLVERVKEFHSRERIKLIYDSSMTTWQFILNFLELARSDGKAGPVAQHLVGAKLELRFPNEAINRESYSTADMQTGRLGDFQIGNTSFHVTVSQMPAIYDKCERNINNGLRPFLLVPYDRLVGVRQNIEASPLGRGKIAAESIESFVSQNIEELSCFSTNQLVDGLFRLLEKYNNRVNEAESDKSLMVDIPQNLSR